MWSLYRGGLVYRWSLPVLWNSSPFEHRVSRELEFSSLLSLLNAGSFNWAESYALSDHPGQSIILTRIAGGWELITLYNSLDLLGDCTHLEFDVGAPGLSVQWT